MSMHYLRLTFTDLIKYRNEAELMYYIMYNASIKTILVAGLFVHLQVLLCERIKPGNEAVSKPKLLQACEVQGGSRDTPYRLVKVHALCSRVRDGSLSSVPSSSAMSSSPFRRFGPTLLAGHSFLLSNAVT